MDKQELKWVQSNSKVSEAIEVVLMHLIESEMGGMIDTDDAWYPIYCELRDLLEKVEDEETM